MYLISFISCGLTFVLKPVQFTHFPTTIRNGWLQFYDSICSLKQQRLFFSNSDDPFEPFQLIMKLSDDKTQSIFFSGRRLSVIVNVMSVYYPWHVLWIRFIAPFQAFYAFCFILDSLVNFILLGSRFHSNVIFCIWFCIRLQRFHDDFSLYAVSIFSIPVL